MNKIDSGVWIISLDFELLWGVFEKQGNHADTAYFVKTKELIPRLLDFFSKYKVEVTWATVGMLFAEDEDEWNQYSPLLKPSYQNNNYSAYHWIKSNGFKKELHFAPDLIKRIVDTPGQELGSHTFAHYYTSEQGQRPCEFRQDLQAAQNISKDKFKIELKSLVFPRNQLNLDYLSICKEEGFTQVRSNPGDWFWQEPQHETLSKKIWRTADCFLSVGKDVAFLQEKICPISKDGIIEIPSSRFLRPYFKNNTGVNSWRLHRVKSEMTAAAKDKKCYHLWWHPHNFANNTEASLLELEELLIHFDTLRKQYGMKSLSMQNLANKVIFPNSSSL